MAFRNQLNAQASDLIPLLPRTIACILSVLTDVLPLRVVPGVGEGSEVGGDAVTSVGDVVVLEGRFPLTGGELALEGAFVLMGGVSGGVETFAALTKLVVTSVRGADFSEFATLYSNVDSKHRITTEKL